MDLIKTTAALLLTFAAPALAEEPTQAQLDAMTALELEFDIHHQTGSAEEVQAAFKKACEGGYSLACQRGARCDDGHEQRGRQVTNGNFPLHRKRGECLMSGHESRSYRGNIVAWQRAGLLRDEKIEHRFYSKCATPTRRRR